MMQEQIADLLQKKKKAMLDFQELLLKEEELFASDDETVLNSLDALMTAKEKILQELGELKKVYAKLHQEKNDSGLAAWQKELQELAESINQKGQDNIARWKEKNGLLQGKIMKLRQGKKILQGYEPDYALPTYFIDKRR
ncbi:MAG: hypothetical protein ACI3ZR_01650 [bacterium]